MFDENQRALVMVETETLKPSFVFAVDLMVISREIAVVLQEQQGVISVTRWDILVSKVDCKKRVGGNQKGNSSHCKGISKSVNSVDDYDEDDEYAFHINGSRTTRGIDSAVASTLIGGVSIHIFMFCPTDFFSN